MSQTRLKQLVARVRVPPPENSYRGGWVDTFRNTVLTQLLANFNQQGSTTGWTYIDYSAGPDKWDISKSVRRQWGINPVFDYGRAMSVLRHKDERIFMGHPFLGLMRRVRECNTEFEEDTDQRSVTINKLVPGFKYYPSTAALLKPIMREQDRAILVEKDPEYFHRLQTYIGKDHRFKLWNLDVYEELSTVRSEVTNEFAPVSIPQKLKRSSIVLEQYLAEIEASQQAFHKAFKTKLRKKEWDTNPRLLKKEPVPNPALEEAQKEAEAAVAKGERIAPAHEEMLKEFDQEDKRVRETLQFMGIHPTPTIEPKDAGLKLELPPLASAPPIPDFSVNESDFTSKGEFELARQISDLHTKLAEYRQGLGNFRLQQNIQTWNKTFNADIKSIDPKLNYSALSESVKANLDQLKSKTEKFAEMEQARIYAFIQDLISDSNIDHAIDSIRTSVRNLSAVDHGNMANYLELLHYIKSTRQRVEEQKWQSPKEELLKLEAEQLKLLEESNTKVKETPKAKATQPSTPAPTTSSPASNSDPLTASINTLQTLNAKLVDPNLDSLTTTEPVAGKTEVEAEDLDELNATPKTEAEFYLKRVHQLTELENDIRARLDEFQHVQSRLVDELFMTQHCLNLLPYQQNAAALQKLQKIYDTRIQEEIRKVKQVFKSKPRHKYPVPANPFPLQRGEPVSFDPNHAWWKNRLASMHHMERSRKLKQYREYQDELATAQKYKDQQEELIDIERDIAIHKIKNESMNAIRKKAIELAIQQLSTTTANTKSSTTTTTDKPLPLPVPVEKLSSSTVADLEIPTDRELYTKIKSLQRELGDFQRGDLKAKYKWLPDHQNRMEREAQREVESEAYTKALEEYELRKSIIKKKGFTLLEADLKAPTHPDAQPKPQELPTENVSDKKNKKKLAAPLKPAGPAVTLPGDIDYKLKELEKKDLEMGVITTQHKETAPTSTGTTHFPIHLAAALAKPLTSHAIVGIDIAELITEGAGKEGDILQVDQTVLQATNSIIKQSIQRFPHATYLISYPIFGRGYQDQLLKAIMETGVRNIIQGTFHIQKGEPYDTASRVYDFEPWGCGVVVIRPPPGFEKTLNDIVNTMSDVMVAYGPSIHTGEEEDAIAHRTFPAPKEQAECTFFVDQSIHWEKGWPNRPDVSWMTQQVDDHIKTLHSFKWEHFVPSYENPRSKRWDLLARKRSDLESDLWNYSRGFRGDDEEADEWLYRYARPEEIRENPFKFKAPIDPTAPLDDGYRVKRPEDQRPWETMPLASPTRTQPGQAAASIDDYARQARQAYDEALAAHEADPSLPKPDPLEYELDPREKHVRSRDTGAIRSVDRGLVKANQRAIARVKEEELRWARDLKRTHIFDMMAKFQKGKIQQTRELEREAKEEKKRIEQMKREGTWTSDQDQQSSTSKRTLSSAYQQYRDADYQTMLEKFDQKSVSWLVQRALLAPKNKETNTTTQQ